MCNFMNATLYTAYDGCRSPRTSPKKTLSLLKGSTVDVSY